MENKVTVIGFTGSGKTTYLTGMYIRMSMGVKNFSLLCKDRNMDLYLENLWEKICEGSKPDPNNRSECYDFHIAHNFKPVCDFKWLDYPGGILADPEHQDRDKLEESIKDSDCLLLIVDGELLADIQDSDANKYGTNIEKLLTGNSDTGYEEDEEEDKISLIQNVLNSSRGIREELKMFTQLSSEGFTLPPIGIVLTKCDLLGKEYQDAVRLAIRNSFPGLFDEPDRIVLLMSVSLGYFTETGFEPRPFCVEQPIAFAVLTILLKYIAALKMEKDKNNKLISEHSGIISSLVNSGKVNKARENVKELGEAVDKWAKDAFGLIDLFSDKKTIYVGGIEKKLREYYRGEFRRLSE